MERDKGKALAAHSTLNRLELGAQAIDARYQKIQPQPDEIQELLIKRGVKEIPRRSAEIVLDFDATDDPLHGSQEGAYFHGYYIMVTTATCHSTLFCGNIPLLAKLRDCKHDASDGTVEALQKIVPVIRQRFGRKVRIIVRADSGFARDAIMTWCEENGVFYCLGLARNERLGERLKGNFENLKADIKETKVEMPCRSFTEFEYSTLNSWTKARRVIGKAEILPKGDNPRFIVRTSTHWMASNQLRLWCSAFAHLIMSTLQATVLKGTELAVASIGQIRLRLFKIAARLTVSVRRIHIELCSAYPLQALFALVHRRLCALPIAA